MNPITLLRQRLSNKSQRDLAKELDVSPQYLNDVLNERREPGESILKPLGLERVISYRKRK